MLTPEQKAIARDLIRQQMARGTVFRFRVASHSMTPVICTGDEVVIGQASVDELRRGDIVLYAVGDAIHVHRLLSVRKQSGVTLLATKGDSALNTDQPWGEHELLGKVVAIWRERRGIDLESRRWRTINHLLALLSQTEAFVFHRGRSLKRAIVGEGRGRLTPMMVKAIRTPFRLCVRLVAGLG